MESVQALDLGLLYFFGGLNRPWLDPVAWAVSVLGCPWTLAGVVVSLAGLFLWLRQFRSAALIVGIACVAAGVQLGVARFVDRPRPEVNWRSIALPDSPGFPDGRAMGAVAVYIGGALLARRFIVVGAVVALLVGLSRPYLGVAYPMDVLAGWVGGLVCALAGSAWRRPHPPNPPLPQGEGGAGQSEGVTPLDVPPAPPLPAGEGAGG